MTQRPPALRPLLPLLLAGCLALALHRALPSAAQEASPELKARPTHELLNATLWVQASAEYQGLCYQAYGLASARLQEALANPGWTADLVQAKTPAPQLSTLPPAVILDVDETVLDNSFYEARLIRRGQTYGPETWDAWCKEERATPIPGALEFCRAAHEAGVTVFYVTNRKDPLREATRNNLSKAGFPLREGVEVVLTRSSVDDKQPRRDAVAKHYRILLLIGDNGTDFCQALGAKTNAETRSYAASQRALWGQRWILLPNPMYGHWEANAVQRKWGDANDLERLRLRAAALSVDPPR